MSEDNKKREALTIHIDGILSDGGDVRLSVFINKLDDFRAALQETDRYLYGMNKNTVEFLISDLTHSSPSAVSIQMQPNGDILDHQDQIFNYLSGLIAEITRGKYRPATASYYLLNKLNELASGIGEKFSTMWLSYKNEVSAVISKETQENLRDLLSKQYAAIGSVKGRVEVYHGHGKENFFYVYPMIGERVKCIFPPSLREQASKAVEQNVTVSGELRYLEGEFFPSELNAHDIEIHKHNDNLQTLAGLIGITEQSDLSTTSVEIVKSLRNGWN